MEISQKTMDSVYLEQSITNAIGAIVAYYYKCPPNNGKERPRDAKEAIKVALSSIYEDNFSAVTIKERANKAHKSWNNNGWYHPYLLGVAVKWKVEAEVGSIEQDKYWEAIRLFEYRSEEFIALIIERDKEKLEEFVNNL